MSAAVEKFLNIPELVEAVLLHLPRRHLLAMRHLSHYFRSIIDKGPQIHQKLALLPPIRFLEPNSSGVKNTTNAFIISPFRPKGIAAAIRTLNNSLGAWMIEHVEPALQSYDMNISITFCQRMHIRSKNHHVVPHYGFRTGDFEPRRQQFNLLVLCPDAPVLQLPFASTGSVGVRFEAFDAARHSHAKDNGYAILQCLVPAGKTVGAILEYLQTWLEAEPGQGNELHDEMGAKVVRQTKRLGQGIFWEEIDMEKYGWETAYRIR